MHLVPLRKSGVTEHNLRDITARCNAERKCRMSLEALIGGKIFIII
jgi:hypothetical protein